jgi:threonine aldolase
MLIQYRRQAAAHAKTDIIFLMHRRTFLAAPLAAYPLAAADSDSEKRVYAYGDGIPHTAAEYSQLLATLTAKQELPLDDYSRGGIVETLENRMAAVLGKEAAVWLPTGTLANHLAVRLLAGNRRRVLVQAESHLYRDCGDCAQTLSGLTLIPLAPGKATFTLDDVQQAAYDSNAGRVLTPIGAIQIESPVRRCRGERFDFEEMKKIAAWARAHNAGLHLDGARLFLESAYSKRPVKEYTALFDTVYVSLYKYFNAASGAILAGPKSLLEGLFHTRRIFGGGLPHVAVALHYQAGFEERFRAAVENSERAIAILRDDSNFAIERIANGTNIFRMRIQNANPPVYQQRLESAGVLVHDATGLIFTLQVNETWNQVPAAEIVARFRRALG